MSVEPVTATHDLVLRGALVFDGSGAAAVQADVAVDGERITAVGTADGRGGVEVDARGLALAPGFIDVHTHDDWALLDDPLLPSKVRQGVTTVITGNCGASPGPFAFGFAPGRRLFPDHASYVATLRAETPAVNVATLVGHGTVRTLALGARTDRPATSAEVREMARVVDGALQAGAVGLSTGLAYEPGRYADTSEIVALARRVGAAGGRYTSHLRDEGSGLVASVAEAISIGRDAGVAVQISHHKAAGRENWGAVATTLRMIDDARAEGLDVAADQYPYTRGSTVLEQLVRAGAFDGPSPFGHLLGDDVLVASSPGSPEREGRTLDDLAAEAGVEVADMAARIVRDEGPACVVVIDTMSEDDVRLVMAHPSTMIGSDGILAGSRPHPRQFHTFPRVLGHYVRDLRVLDLPTALHRMTGLPARTFGLVDRGVLRPGAFADLVLFDAAVVADRGTYEAPTSAPVGIRGVWVNGRRVLDGVEPTGARPGRVLGLVSP